MKFCRTFATLFKVFCCCSSVVEHFLGKEEVTSSSLVNSSKMKRNHLVALHLFFVGYRTRDLKALLYQRRVWEG